MKFDFPEPFGPMMMLTGLSNKFSTDARLLKPLIVT